MTRCVSELISLDKNAVHPDTEAMRDMSAKDGRNDAHHFAGGVLKDLAFLEAV
ncbi:hypothetical protein [Mesorhizobium caraganae]|uniref:hypothetical protein n=1 Tax=Mesorhizobium caraganae TaxID=483206 RepID=UPI00177CB970|nr:hypothetical protein [Mesorhizobium caraganae]